MKKLKLLALGMALAWPVVTQATIIGSAHDFSTNNWDGRYGVCSPCHQAHHTDTLIPLWSHETTVATFQLYSSSSFDGAATQTQPAGRSKACLSCHDGTVAINSWGGRTNGAGGPVFIGGAQFPGGLIGTDLRHTHPVSFTYDAALAAADGFLFNPDVETIGHHGLSPGGTNSLGAIYGQTINHALLGGGHQMECSSCHDVHKMKGSSTTSGIMLIISGRDANNKGSLLCRTCHNK